MFYGRCVRKIHVLRTMCAENLCTQDDVCRKFMYPGQCVQKNSVSRTMSEEHLYTQHDICEVYPYDGRGQYVYLGQCMGKNCRRCKRRICIPRTMCAGFVFQEKRVQGLYNQGNVCRVYMPREMCAGFVYPGK